MDAANDAPRQKAFLLAGPEQRALHWLAARMPARVLPDHLTALGVLAALGIAGAYLASNADPAWLWVASALLVVHWLGDSLDGTLALPPRGERGVRRSAVPRDLGLAARGGAAEVLERLAHPRRILKRS